MTEQPPQKHYFAVPANWNEMTDDEKEAWGREFAEHVREHAAKDAERPVERPGQRGTS